MIRHNEVVETRKVEVPKKVVRLTRMAMEGFQTMVYTQEALTNSINMRREVVQVDGLSTTISNVVINVSMVATGWGHNIVMICRFLFLMTTLWCGQGAGKALKRQ